MEPGGHSSTPGENLGDPTSWQDVCVIGVIQNVGRTIKMASWFDPVIGNTCCHQHRRALFDRIVSCPVENNLRQEVNHALNAGFCNSATAGVQVAPIRNSGTGDGHHRHALFDLFVLTVYPNICNSTLTYHTTSIYTPRKCLWKKW